MGSGDDFIKKAVFDHYFKKVTTHLSIWAGVVGLIILLIVIASGIVIVEKGEAAVLIAKTGEDLARGEVIAMKDGQKGIKLDPLAEGWYWYNPYSWDWVIVPQLEIPQGKVGVKIRNFGTPPSPNQVIAGDGQKGILVETLRPGRYLINPFAYGYDIKDAVTVPPGHAGVVTRVSGADPKSPNDFLVDPGERGVQRETVPPGTYYPNPYIERITPVDTRSHRFDMMGQSIIRFPSLDGFDITMEGTIEWYIDPARVSEVFVKYVDAGGDTIVAITRKIILPNARTFSRLEGSKHLARDFISGVTRQAFQDAFRQGLAEACMKQGIVINSALVRDTMPPEAIAGPIRDREIAKRNAEKYTQEIERERQQKLLAMEEKIKERKTLVKAAEADVAVDVTKAKQDKEVALIEAQRMLEVAKLQLEAAQNEAAAIVAQGKAKADVVVYKNAAEAAGLRHSVEAFQSGETYVRYLMNQKLAPSFRYILSNTEGGISDIFKNAVDGSKGGK